MTWVAWRQHRASVIASLAVIGLAAAAIVALRLVVNAAAADAGGAGCLSSGGECPSDFILDGQYRSQISTLALLVAVLPFGVGALAGAPLFAREVSHGQHLFSLTQSVSRRRWWATKLLVVLVPIAAGMLALGLLSRWLLWPMLDLDGGPLDPSYFSSQGPAMAGYLILALVTASAIGLFTKNITIPVAATAGLLLVLTLVVVSFVRPHYMPQETFTVEGDDPAMTTNVQNYQESWPLGHVYVATNGDRGGVDVCGTAADCEVKETEVFYQPADRFWAFQGIETALYLLLAAGAVMVSAYGVRARLP